MNEKNLNLKTYNKIAEEWHRDHQADTWWINGTNKFISLLKHGSSVLDVGCAGGVKSRYLIKKGLNVTGIDFSEKMIEIAKREIPEGEFCVIDMNNISELKKEFDGIFTQAVLLHIPKKDVKSVLDGIINKLKDGGYLYIAVKEKRSNQQEEEIMTEGGYGYKYKRFFSYFSIEELRRYLSDLDMEISYENISTSGNTNWIQVIARKK